jgi:hypothetical protein
MNVAASTPHPLVKHSDDDDNAWWQRANASFHYYLFFPFSTLVMAMNMMDECGGDGLSV